MIKECNCDAPNLRKALDEKDKQIAAQKQQLEAQQEMMAHLSQQNMRLEKTMWSQTEALTKATHLICDLMKDRGR